MVCTKKKAGRKSSGLLPTDLCTYQPLGGVYTLTGVQGTAAVT